MLGYMELSDDILNVVKPYIKKGEGVKISGEIDLNGKLYREVVFSKRNLKSFKNEHQGYLYLDKDNSIITSENVLKDLTKLAYYYEIFFSGEKGIGILTALHTEGDMDRAKGNLQEVIAGLDFLYEQGIENAKKVKEVVQQLPILREESNVKIEELGNLIYKIKEKADPFKEEMLKNLLPLYEELLKKNFNKVKLIATLEDCCNEVKNAAEKTRRKWSVRLKRGSIGPLLRASDEIGYFIRIIKTYESVLSMNSSQYMKFLSDLNKQKTENRFNLVRR